MKSVKVRVVPSRVSEAENWTSGFVAAKSGSYSGVEVVIEFYAEELAFDLRPGRGIDGGWRTRGFVCLSGTPAERQGEQGQGG